jgi:glycosyltransferase involved in cell wall biosynthesis
VRIGRLQFAGYHSNMVKIAMIVSNHYDPDPRVHKEATTLVGAGYDVTVYAFDRQHMKPPGQETVDGVKIARIRTHRVAYGATFSTAVALRAFKKTVKQRLIRNPPSVVHCHDQDTCSVGLWWQRKSAPYLNGDRGKFVFDAHDLYWTYLTQQRQHSRIARMASTFLRTYDRFVASKADLLITTSEAIGRHSGFAETYREWGCKPVVVWNAPFKPNAIPPLPERFTVGYVGTVRYFDMFEWLVKAIERLDPAERPDVLLAGHGVVQPKVAEYIAAAAERLRFKFTATGAFGLDELSALIGKTSLQYCVYPDASENIRGSMSVKLLDSVAHGRKVIGNTDCLMGDWINLKQWGWEVKSGDIGAIHSALREGYYLTTQFRDVSLTAPPYWSDQEVLLLAAYQHQVLPNPVLHDVRVAVNN